MTVEYTVYICDTQLHWQTFRYASASKSMIGKSLLKENDLYLAY